jgi:hypothetical protein
VAAIKTQHEKPYTFIGARAWQSFAQIEVRTAKGEIGKTLKTVICNAAPDRQATYVPTCSTKINARVKTVL